MAVGITDRAIRPVPTEGGTVQIVLKTGEVVAGVFTDAGGRKLCAVRTAHWTPFERGISGFLAKSNGMNAYVLGVFRTPAGREVKAVRLARPDECQTVAQIKRRYLESWARACETCVESD